MTMNKKEQAEFDAAKKAVIVARALNWSEPVLPDLNPPMPGSGAADVLGFVFNAYSGTISYARTSSVYHAKDRSDFPAKTDSQKSLRLYSTKLLALRALRHEVEKECAEKLAKIDMQIQAAKDFQP